MNRHTDYTRFDCAGGMLPARKPKWDALPLLKAITVVCALLALATVW